MTMRTLHTAPQGLSLLAHALKLLLRLMGRKKIWASVAGMEEGIRRVRQEGPARPGPSVLRHAELRTETIAGCEVYTLVPRDGVSAQTFLYLHGGGYIRPITKYHWEFLAWLVQAQRATVVVPLYPLAPESTCQATVQAVRSVHDLAAQRHGRFDAFIGDSAGAGLCLALCQDLRKAALELPRRMVLICPFVDVTLSNPAIIETDQRDLMLGLAGAREAGRLYSGDLPVDHPLVSPVNADLRGFPTMQLFVATDDIASHDALILAERAREAGVEAEVHIGHGLMHVWPILPIPEARTSRAAMNEFLQAGG